VIWNRHRNAKEKDLSMDASEIAKIRRITAEMAAITHRMPENSTAMVTLASIPPSARPGAWHSMTRRPSR
jgi:hypothetical protein